MVILRKAQQFDMMVSFLVMGFIFFLRSVHGTQLFPTLHEFGMPVWAIGFQYTIGLIFIFVNVIPKYLHFGGAKRHLNDNQMRKKSYFTRNYVRLFFHIISGASLYVFIGVYFLFESHLSPIMPLGFWKFFIIFWDLIHQITIILMTRNHDGIYILRAGNVLLAFIKCLFDMEIFYATNLAQIRPFALSVWFYTQGFAGTRLFSFLVAMAEMLCGYEFDRLRENWYSIGLSGAQIYVFIFYPRAMLLYCACMFTTAMQYKHELWTKRDNYQMRAMAISFLPMMLSIVSIFVPYGTCPSFFVGDYAFLNEVLRVVLDNMALHTLYSIFLIWFCFHHLGMYYKRLPLKGVDYVTPKCPGVGAYARAAGITECPTTGTKAGALPPTGQENVERKASTDSTSSSSSEDMDDSGSKDGYDSEDDSDFSDDDEEVVNTIHPDLMKKSMDFKNNIFSDFDAIMDQKLAKGLNSTVSLESRQSMMETESGREVEVRKVKMTEGSEGRVESMHTRMSFY